MINPLPRNILTLWQIAGITTPAALQNNWNTHFDPIGLILLTPQEDFDQECLIPINTLTFATTGGGSVHYGLLSIEGIFSDNSPIVMTVPNSDKPHMIVGEKLSDFLGLGIRTGYRTLEDLAYDYHDAERFEQSANLYEQPEFAKELIPSSTEEALLMKLERTFNAKPWEHVKDKLLRLDELYIDKLNTDFTVYP